MTGVRSSTVDGVVTRSARRTPDRTAVRYAERSWTYRALDTAVSTAAAVLLDGHGLHPGDRVACYAHNSDAYLIAYLACARAGLVHVPVNQNLTGEDLTYILQQSGSALVLTDTDLADRIPVSFAVRPLRDAPHSLLGELATPRSFTAEREPAMRRPGAAALHIGHHRAPQRRDDDARRPRPRVRQRDHRPRSASHRPARPLTAALPLRADACVPAAVPRGRRGEHHPRRARSGPDLRPRRGRAGGQSVRPADRLDRPRQPPAVRHPGPPRAAQGVLRRVDHAGSGAGTAPRAVARAGLLQLLRTERDRPARHRPRARRARGPDGLLR